MMRGELLVAVVDGQGGGMGRGLVEAVKKKWPSLHVRALGTNSLATAAMLRAGAELWASSRWRAQLPVSYSHMKLPTNRIV